MSGYYRGKGLQENKKTLFKKSLTRKFVRGTPHKQTTTTTQKNTHRKILKS